jgi:hypothetical protein
MPQVIVAVVAAAAAKAVGAAVTGAVTGAVVGGVTIGTTAAAFIGAVAGAVVATGVTFAGSAILGIGKTKNRSANSATASAASTTRAAQDRRQMVRSTVEPRSIVYGLARVSGPLIYASSSGEDQRFLHLVVPLAAHPVNAIRAVWINDVRVDSSQIDMSQGGFVSDGPLRPDDGQGGRPLLVRIRRYLGTQTQADPDLVAESVDGWSAAHVLRGIAYVYVRLEYNQVAFPNGLQNVGAEIEGKSTIFDPRTGGTSYSTNTALCILDYLRSPDGFACADDEIDFASFIAAANICDEAVQVDAAGTFHQRYQIGAAFALDRAPLDIMEDMLAACGGTLVYVAGRYRMHVGAYDAPTDTLTAADLAGPVNVVTKRPRRERFNGVRGTFVDPGRNFQAADFPPLSDAAAVAEDGESIWTDLELPAVNDVYRAQRLARMALRRHREAITISVPVQYRGLRYSVWQTLSVTLPDFGWAGKVFRVTSWSFDAASGTISLVMVEESAFSYAWEWEAANALGPSPDTNLVSPFVVPAPAGLQVADTLAVAADGRGLETQAIVSWVAAAHPFVRGYEVQRRASDSTLWQTVATTDGATLRAVVTGMAEGLYAWRVRAVTIYGGGAWAEVQARVGLLIAQPPADLTGLQVQAIGGMAYVSWDQPADLDVRFGGQIEFRHTPQTVSPVWSASTGIGSAVPGSSTFAVLPLKPGTYLAKATDAGGRYSAGAAVAVAQQATAVGFVPITNATEHPGFTGARVNAVVTSGTVRLDSTGLIDPRASFDAIADLDALGGIAATGRYDFATAIDLGLVRACRLTGRISAVVVNTLDFVDARSAALDAWLDFDGVSGNEADAWIEVRQTDDNPGGTPTWTAWRRLDSGEFRARAFQFRVQLRTLDPSFNIHISELSVNADEVA